MNPKFSYALVGCLTLAGMGSSLQAEGGTGPRPAALGLYCLSFHLAPASVRVLGLDYSIEFTSAGESTPSLYNGEFLRVFETAPTSHASRFRLRTELLPDPLTGVFYLDIPEFTDANENGLNDFYEFSEAVNATSIGGFIDDLVGDEGAARATWYRQAGSASGTCQLMLQNSFLQVTFIHTFEILEWQGNLHYQVANGRVDGQVDWQRAGSPAAVMGGAMVLSQVDTNHLLLRAGFWTNQLAQVWNYLGSAAEESIERFETNYVGYLDAQDGDLETPIEDYLTWLLLITDTNDADQDGVPDLSDTPPASTPRLTVTLAGDHVQLLIHEAAGQSGRIEQALTLPSTNWITVQPVTVTNDPQVVSLEMPAQSIVFWRFAR